MAQLRRYPPAKGRQQTVPRHYAEQGRPPAGKSRRLGNAGISRSIVPSEQAAIYRIVQELLSNAIRHASASVILVQCSQNEDIFFISVEDDGRGFRPADVHDNGIGLSNVRNRVDFLKGKMEIHSTPSEGTTINIEVHVHK